MQTTEKLDIPFQPEINHLAAIQVQQSESFNLSITKQFELFKNEYQLTLKSYYSNNQQELIKKIELVDFMFDVHMQSFGLPKAFQQLFNLLKIITAKSALYHSAFFSHAHNPVAHYLRTASSHIKQKLNSKNKAECLKLLNENIQLIIIKYQSNPSFFDAQTKVIVKTFKPNKKLIIGSDKKKPSLKTSYLKDTFSREVINIKDAASKKNNVFLFTAKNIKKGEWINLKLKGRNTALIKLIWKANDNSEFIFVNKEGEKVRQCNLLELAADLENGVVSTQTNETKTKIGKRNDSFLKTIG